MTHLDPLFLQVLTQQVKYYYGYAQIEDANSDCHLPIFVYQKNKNSNNVIRHIGCPFTASAVNKGISCH